MKLLQSYVDGPRAFSNDVVSQIHFFNDKIPSPDSPKPVVEDHRRDDNTNVQTRSAANFVNLYFSC